MVGPLLTRTWVEKRRTSPDCSMGEGLTLIEIREGCAGVSRKTENRG